MQLVHRECPNFRVNLSAALFLCMALGNAKLYQITYDHLVGSLRSASIEIYTRKAVNVTMSGIAPAISRSGWTHQTMRLMDKALFDHGA